MKMKKEVGQIEFPLWLLGDSNPKNWEHYLRSPFDPRHPTRHNIWTSILDEIQDRVFRARRLRIDATRIYIRNAVEDPDTRPDRYTTTWSSMLDDEIASFYNALVYHKPSILISFGSFSYEFARRALDIAPIHSVNYWSTKRLGGAFRAQIEAFSPSHVNTFPLLHRSISGRHLISSHNHYCGRGSDNYFTYVAEHLAKKFLEHQDALDIWIH